MLFTQEKEHLWFPSREWPLLVHIIVSNRVWQKKKWRKRDSSHLFPKNKLIVSPLRMIHTKMLLQNWLKRSIWAQVRQCKKSETASKKSREKKNLKWLCIQVNRLLLMLKAKQSKIFLNHCLPIQLLLQKRKKTQKKIVELIISPVW